MNDKIIIGLAGETGSGKDTVANHLKKRYHANLFRFSYPLKQALSLFFDHPSKDDQAWLFGQFSSRFGSDILQRGMRRRIERSDDQIVCINGVRLPQDEEFVRSFPNSLMLYVTADQRVRWERSYVRGEKSDDEQSFGEFQKWENETPTEKHVQEIGAHAEFKIDNAEGLDQLLRAVDDVMAEILVKSFK